MTRTSYHQPAGWALQVIEEESVRVAVNLACQKYPQAEDMFNAATWRLARDRECGLQIEDKEPYRRIIKVNPIKGAKSPSLLVRYYILDEDSLIVDWVKFYPFDETKAVDPLAYVFKPE